MMSGLDCKSAGICCLQLFYRWVQTLADAVKKEIDKTARTAEPETLFNLERP